MPQYHLMITPEMLKSGKQTCTLTQPSAEGNWDKQTARVDKFWDTNLNMISATKFFLKNKYKEAY